MGTSSTKTDQLTVHGSMDPGYEEILTPEALHFISELHRRFNDRRLQLLARRADRQTRIDAGEIFSVLTTITSGRYLAMTLSASATVPYTGRPMIRRCRLVASSSRKPMGMLSYLGLLLSSRTRSAPPSPAPHTIAR